MPRRWQCWRRVAAGRTAADLAITTKKLVIFRRREFSTPPPSLWTEAETIILFRSPRMPPSGHGITGRAHSAVFFGLSPAEMRHPNRLREVDKRAKLHIWTTFEQNLPWTLEIIQEMYQNRVGFATFLIFCGLFLTSLATYGLLRCPRLPNLLVKGW